MNPFIVGLLLTANSFPSVLSVPPFPPSPQEIWINALANCESNGSTTIKVIDTNGYYSYGKYQWQMRSWLKYKDIGATKDNILNEKVQDKVTKYVLDNLGDLNWINCGKIIRSSLGSYPD